MRPIASPPADVPARQRHSSPTPTPRPRPATRPSITSKSPSSTLYNPIQAIAATGKNYDQLISGLRAQAARLGCDAVIAVACCQTPSGEVRAEGQGIKWKGFY